MEGRAEFPSFIIPENPGKTIPQFGRERSPRADGKSGGPSPVCHPQGGRPGGAAGTARRFPAAPRDSRIPWSLGTSPRRFGTTPGCSSHRRLHGGYPRRPPPGILPPQIPRTIAPAGDLDQSPFPDGPHPSPPSPLSGARTKSGNGCQSAGGCGILFHHTALAQPPAKSGKPRPGREGAHP